MEPSELQSKKKPSAKERLLSLVLLGTVAMIAFVMLLIQGKFDPGAWREKVSAANEPATRRPASDPGDHSPEGLVPLSALERYDTESLSDKIDGKADLYLSTGFRGLATRRFALATDKRRWMERYVYDMGELSNAFAVFSSQRRRNIQPLDLTAYAYLAGNGLFFVRGPFYVEIIAAEPSADVQAGMRALAAAFVRDHPVAAGKLPELALFPVDHRVAESTQLTTRSAFGIEGLDGIFTAAYAKDQAQALAFFARRSTAAEAGGSARKFTAFWTDFGGEAVAPPTDLKDAAIVSIMDNYEISMVADGWFFGVHEATDLAFGLDLVRQLRRSLTGAVP